MTEYRCYEKDVEAPRVRCGCENCYRTRERRLDPDLMALARRDYSISTITSARSSREIVYRCIMEYLVGRVDYGAMHLGIIKALMEFADKQFELTMEIVSRQSPVVVLKDSKS